jgi:putative flippase GtrA
MTKIINWIKSLVSHSEKIRFILVGVFNTFFGFFIYSLIVFFFGKHSYMWALLTSQILATLVAFPLHRNKVFKADNNIFLEFLRFASVNIVLYLYNWAVLPILVSHFKIDPIVSQFLVTLTSVGLSYLGHKYFSFRKTGGGDEKTN